MDQVRSSAHAQQPSDIALITRLKEIKIFDKKWELLKDVLEPLFAKESVDTIANAMERRFNFRAKSVPYSLSSCRGTDLVLVRRHTSTGSNGGDGLGKRTVLESPSLSSNMCCLGPRREWHEARVLLLNTRVKPFILIVYSPRLVHFSVMTK